MKTESDLYIIALGANDIKYRNKNICAMTKKEYINNIREIITFSKKYNKKAKFLLIAPWFYDDKNPNLKEIEKNKLLNEYADILKNYCNKNNYLFINPSPFIYNIIKKNISNYILSEYNGIELYYKAVLNNSE